VIDFSQGDRVLIEDAHALYTGEVLAPAGMIRTDCCECQGWEILYVIALDDGRTLLAGERSMWPEAGPIPAEPEPDPDGCHTWPRGMGARA
jgi:hypothetical protein